MSNLGIIEISATNGNLFQGALSNDFLICSQNPASIWLGCGSNAPNYLQIGSNMTFTSNVTASNAAFSNLSSLNAAFSNLTVGSNIVCSGNISAGNLGMFRNRIINGDMSINQRAATTITTPVNGNVFLVDRFNTETTIATGRYTITQNALSVTDSPFTSSGLQNYVRCTTTTAITSYTFLNNLQHKIESYYMKDFNWGTSVGVSITLSFWIRTSLTAGSIYNVCLRNADVTQSYNLGVTITNPGSWQYVNATIPPPTQGSTWCATLNGLGMIISFGANDPNGRTTTANTWESANKYGSTLATPLTALNSYVDITGVQLEKGRIATPFEFRPYPIELQLCQRYFNRIGGPSESDTYVNVGLGSSSGAVKQLVFLYNFPVAMRISQTPITFGGVWISWGINSPGFTTIALNASGNTNKACQIVFTHTQSFTYSTAGSYLIYRNNNTDAYIDISAEF
jgi:hypothetical protein